MAVWRRRPNLPGAVFFFYSLERHCIRRGETSACARHLGTPRTCTEHRDARLQLKRLNSAKCFIRTREKRSEDAKNCLMKSAYLGWRGTAKVLTDGEEFYCSGISQNLKTLSTQVRTTRCVGVRGYRKNYPQFPHHSCAIEVEAIPVVHGGGTGTPCTPKGTSPTHVSLDRGRNPEHTQITGSCIRSISLTAHWRLYRSHFLIAIPTT